MSTLSVSAEVGVGLAFGLADCISNVAVPRTLDRITFPSSGEKLIALLIRKVPLMPTAGCDPADAVCSDMGMANV